MVEELKQRAVEPIQSSLAEWGQVQNSRLRRSQGTSPLKMFKAIWTTTTKWFPRVARVVDAVTVFADKRTM